MKLDLTDIVDKNKGTIGIVAGLGPSLKTYLDEIEDISKNDRENYTVVSCNRFHAVTKMIPTYWLIANSNTNQQITRVAGVANGMPDTTLIYSDTVDTTPKPNVANLLTNDYIGFDQRHFRGHHCKWGKGKDGRSVCCNHMEAGRLPIQELLMKYTNIEYGDDAAYTNRSNSFNKINNTYSSGDSVILHEITIAIITGCNPIYIGGVDLDYSGDGYVNKDPDPHGQQIGANIGPSVYTNVKNDLSIINTMAKNVNIEIFSLNKAGILSEIFEFKEFNNKNDEKEE